jgi:hypothetical protein
MAIFKKMNAKSAEDLAKLDVIRNAIRLKVLMCAECVEAQEQLAVTLNADLLRLLEVGKLVYA